MNEIKSKIEAILFCLPQGIDTRALAKKLNLGSKGRVKAAIKELQEDYKKRSAGLVIVKESGAWKFKIPDEFLGLIKEAAEPEMNTATLQTLAYIAYRRGSRQCDVVRVRSNKAYDHIKELLAKGFLSSEKSGLSKFLRPTKKFYEYFKLKPGEKLKIPEDKKINNFTDQAHL
ncbi:hypothetical protein GF374_02655 [Candidatus Woesearchaeota archaeon]|nr:hypothetical protein [Candidatus Woesearchaeota archaeon]